MKNETQLHQYYNLDLRSNQCNPELEDSWAKNTLLLRGILKDLPEADKAVANKLWDAAYQSLMMYRGNEFSVALSLEAYKSKFSAAEQKSIEQEAWDNF